MPKPVAVADLQIALRTLQETTSLRLLVIFGSVSKKSIRPDSDLDLGYISDEPIDETKLTSEIIRLTHWNDVDIVNLRRVSPLLGMEIARSAQVIFEEDKSLLPEFVSYAVRRYLDSEKLRVARSRSLDLFEKNHEPH